MNILILDDSQTMQLKLTRMFRELFPESEITQATNAEEVIGILPKIEFEIATIDNNLPGMTGLDFIEHLRAQNHKTALALVTGNHQKLLGDQAKRMEVKVIKKPTNTAERIQFETELAKFFNSFQF